MNSVVKRTSSIGPLKSKYFRFTSRNRSSSCPVKSSKAETAVSQARPEPTTVAPKTSKTQAYPSQHLDVPGLYNLQVSTPTLLYQISVTGLGSAQVSRRQVITCLGCFYPTSGDTSQCRGDLHQYWTPAGKSAFWAPYEPYVMVR